MRVKTIFLLAVITLTAVAIRPQVNNSLSLESNVLLKRNSTATSGEVEVTFKNTSSSTTRLFAAFDSKVKRRSSFMVTLTDSSGEMFGPYGGASISLPVKDFKYVEIGKDDILKVILDIKEFLPKNRSFATGLYIAHIQYVNRYGLDCFHGTLDGGEVQIFLE